MPAQRRFLGAGATVVLVDRDAEALKRIRSELGGNACPLLTDLSNTESVKGMLPHILRHVGQLDIFHANAGSYVGGAVVAGDPEAWDRMRACMLAEAKNGIAPAEPARRIAGWAMLGRLASNPWTPALTIQAA